MVTTGSSGHKRQSDITNMWTQQTFGHKRQSNMVTTVDTNDKATCGRKWQSNKQSWMGTTVVTGSHNVTTSNSACQETSRTNIISSCRIIKRGSSSSPLVELKPSCPTWLRIVTRDYKLVTVWPPISRFVTSISSCFWTCLKHHAF